MSEEQILVIESDPERLTRYTSELALWGYEVYSAETAERGRELFRSLTPDLILIALLLPDQPGLLLLKELKEGQGDSQLFSAILLSDDRTEEVRIVALSAGADDLLLYDISPVDLAIKVQTSLELLHYRKKITELNRQLEREKSLLLRYFPEGLVERILNEDIRPELGGSLGDATVLFFDIRQSTHIAETIGASKYSLLISRLLEQIMEQIFLSHGSVNEIQGDGILATFGCPEASEEHSLYALQAAKRISATMSSFNREERAQYYPEPIGFGMGLASGRIFSGNIGSNRHMKYAVMGPAVNRAARIQDLTKELARPILIEESILRYLPQKDKLSVGLSLEEVGRFPLKGVGEPEPLLTFRNIAPTNS